MMTPTTSARKTAGAMLLSDENMEPIESIITTGTMSSPTAHPASFDESARFHQLAAPVSDKHCLALHLPLAVEQFQFALDAQDAEVVRHAVRLLLDALKHLRADRAIAPLHRELALAIHAGDEPRIGGNLQRGAAVVATDGQEFHARGA